MEKSVIIHCDNIRLEGMLNNNSSTRAVVVTHPHPLYGGNMDNPVVGQIIQSFCDKGFTTLRFNFRGTAGSSGMFDNGIGEQDDVRAALEYVKESGFSGLWLAGYSFGARMNASVIGSGYGITDHIMVSPPMGFMSFEDVASMPSTGLILTGANDEIAPPDMILAAINRWQIQPRFEVIDGCDHFYTGQLDKLGMVFSDYLV